MPAYSPQNSSKRNRSGGRFLPTIALGRALYGADSAAVTHSLTALSRARFGDPSTRTTDVANKAGLTDPGSVAQTPATEGVPPRLNRESRWIPLLRQSLIVEHPTRVI
jgi:hypothetical protein